MTQTSSARPSSPSPNGDGVPAGPSCEERSDGVASERTVIGKNKKKKTTRNKEKMKNTSSATTNDQLVLRAAASIAATMTVGMIVWLAVEMVVAVAVPLDDARGHGQRGGRVHHLGVGAFVVGVLVVAMAGMAQKKRNKKKSKKRKKRKQEMKAIGAGGGAGPGMLESGGEPPRGKGSSFPPPSEGSARSDPAGAESVIPKPAANPSGAAGGLMTLVDNEGTVGKRRGNDGAGGTKKAKISSAEVEHNATAATAHGAPQKKYKKKKKKQETKPMEEGGGTGPGMPKSSSQPLLGEGSSLPLPSERATGPTPERATINAARVVQLPSATMAHGAPQKKTKNKKKKTKQRKRESEKAGGGGGTGPEMPVSLVVLTGSSPEGFSGTASMESNAGGTSASMSVGTGTSTASTSCSTTIRTGTSPSGSFGSMVLSVRPSTGEDGRGGSLDMSAGASSSHRSNNHLYPNPTGTEPIAFGPADALFADVEDGATKDDPPNREGSVDFVTAEPDVGARAGKEQPCEAPTPTARGAPPEEDEKGEATSGARQTPDRPKLDGASGERSDETPTEGGEEASRRPPKLLTNSSSAEAAREAGEALNIVSPCHQAGSEVSDAAALPSTPIKGETPARGGEESDTLPSPGNPVLVREGGHEGAEEHVATLLGRASDPGFVLVKWSSNGRNAELPRSQVMKMPLKRRRTGVGGGATAPGADAAPRNPRVCKGSKKRRRERCGSEGATGCKVSKKRRRSKLQSDCSPRVEDESFVVQKSRVSCSSGPFHVDVAARKSFYKDIDIVPPFNSYVGQLSDGGGASTKNEKWKVKLGDTVALEYADESKKSGKSGNDHPFVVPWAPVEIVSIYCVHETRESCARLREGKDLLKEDDVEIMVEVRWFYKPHEIPGESKKKSKSTDDNRLEEVLETDHIDVCGAESILSPVQLHDAATAFAEPRNIGGMPLIHYHCIQFWSILRKAPMPSGSFSGRMLRGRMYSAHESALLKLRPPLTAGSSAPVCPKCGASWKEAFQTAIQKLSLADAARDAQENRMVMACRNEEREHITRFLRMAIGGSMRASREGEATFSMHMKSSLFISGPPGTGKTALVRSVLAELQEEQHAGVLPVFNIITLNGMEFRSPLDAYIKFWEAVSGPRREMLPAGEAAHELEHYFCGKVEECSHADLSSRPVTVLILDEIDCLVTKKQTLIYNLFDWPLRATTARLVVIGISNLINLPEKLSTRVQSRIGGDRCHFKSYTATDAETILKTRLGMLGCNPGNAVFEEDAIKFASRKTANLSGDIRKAFQICKSAAEAVLEDCSSGKQQSKEGSWPMVNALHVANCSRDMFTSIVHKAVSYSTSYEALFLVSLGALKRTQEEGSFAIQDILTKIESIANVSGEPAYMNARLSFQDVLGMASRLGEAGIIQLNSVCSSTWPRVSTHLHSSEILRCYRDTRHEKLAGKHLTRQRLF